MPDARIGRIAAIHRGLTEAFGTDPTETGVEDLLAHALAVFASIKPEPMGAILGVAIDAAHLTQLGLAEDKPEPYSLTLRSYAELAEDGVAILEEEEEEEP